VNSGVRRSTGRAPDLVGDRRQAGQERARRRQRLDALLQRGRRTGDRLAQRARFARQALEGVGHAGEAARERVRQGREHAGDVGGLVEQPHEARVGVRQRAHHRRQVAEQLRRGAERAADRLAAAGQPAAEVVEVAVDVLARRLVEDREEVVELGADGVRAGGDRGALGQRLAGLAAHELDVLQAERRARADADGRVGRDRRRGLVEAQRQLRAPVAAGNRLDLRHLADAEAALADLVADDEAGGVGRVDLHLEGRHERQSAVGLVGEQHRDEDDEHGDRPDEDGVGRDGWRAAASHGPSR
jgi:hypothetical protein